MRRKWPALHLLCSAETASSGRAGWIGQLNESGNTVKQSSKQIVYRFDGNGTAEVRPIRAILHGNQVTTNDFGEKQSASQRK